MNIGRQPLIRVLRDTRSLLALPDNDFLWSSWKNAEAALRDIDDFIEKIKSGVKFNEKDLVVLFAPTGPIQEVSLSSGWGERFLALAHRFDIALAWFRISSILTKT